LVRQPDPTWEEVLLARGEAVGEVRGRAEGALQPLRQTLQRQLQNRFGPLPEELQGRIANANAAQLDAALDQVTAIRSLAELKL
jgi:hypothetical protein